MLNRFKILMVSVSVPEVRWLKLPIPFIMVYQLIDCLMDLSAMLSMIVPRALLEKEYNEVKKLRTITELIEEVVTELANTDNKELIKIHVGKDNVDILVKRI